MRIFIFISMYICILYVYVYIHICMFTFVHIFIYFYYSRLLQQQSNRKHTLAAVKAKQMQEATISEKRVNTANASQKNATTSGGGAVVGLIEDDDDGKLAADLEFKMMAMNLAAKEQQEYCQKYVIVIYVYVILLFLY